MMPENDIDDASGLPSRRDLLDDNDNLRAEIGRLRGRLEVLEERITAQDAADEHHRAELDSARLELADAWAELNGAQARTEEWRRRVADAEERRTLAERQREKAETERAAVIAALGRRARNQLGGRPDESA